MDKVSLSRNPREEHSEEEHGGQRPRPGGEEWDWRVQKTEKAEPGGCCYLCHLPLLPMAHLAFHRILIQFRSLCCLNFLCPLLSHLKSSRMKLISRVPLAAASSVSRLSRRAVPGPSYKRAGSTPSDYQPISTLGSLLLVSWQGSLAQCEADAWSPKPTAFFACSLAR